MGDSSVALALALGGGFNFTEGPPNGQPERPEHGPSGFVYSSGLSEKYARGALSVVINFDPNFRCRVEHGHHGPGLCHKRITFNRVGQPPIPPVNPDRWMAGSPEGWGNNSVLIVIVQFCEIVEIVPTPFGEGFLSADGVFHPLTGCYYSIAGSFEVNSAIACNEFGMAILCAAPHGSKLPSNVVQGHPQIVNSICYYKGDVVRQALSGPNGEGLNPGLRIAMDLENVWFTGVEGVCLPFEVRNVIIGPMNFLFGTGEHDAQNPRPQP